jgi:hypothetical protein
VDAACVQSLLLSFQHANLTKPSDVFCAMQLIQVGLILSRTAKVRVWQKKKGKRIQLVSWEYEQKKSNCKRRALLMSFKLQITSYKLVGATSSIWSITFLQGVNLCIFEQIFLISKSHALNSAAFVDHMYRTGTINCVALFVLFTFEVSHCMFEINRHTVSKPRPSCGSTVLVES